MVAERDEIPVVSYARISADIERDEHGVQAQHSTNRATAARYGWSVVHEFTDNDKSAAKSNVVRDDFEAMVRALRSGKLPNGTAVQGVVVVAATGWHVDRATTNASSRRSRTGTDGCSPTSVARRTSTAKTLRASA